MKKPKKILVIDNKIDPPKGSLDLCRFISKYPVLSRRGCERDLPTDLKQFSHIVISGSRESCSSLEPWVEEVIATIKNAYELSIPTLGVCFGHQMIARAFGGIEAVGRSKTPEFGWIKIQKKRTAQKNPLIKNLKDEFFSFAAHWEEVMQLAQGFVIDSTSPRCAIQSFYHEQKPIWGVQFHPERTAEEGDVSISSRWGKVPNDALFNAGKSKECYDPNVTQEIFDRFLEIET